MPPDCLIAIAHTSVSFAAMCLPPLSAWSCCHVPTSMPSPLSALLPCAYSSLACTVCCQVAAAFSLTSDSPRPAVMCLPPLSAWSCCHVSTLTLSPLTALLPCAHSSLACKMTAARLLLYYMCLPSCCLCFPPLALVTCHPETRQMELIKPVLLGTFFSIEHFL